MTIERDVAITLRDGARIYADIYRPMLEAGSLPALLAWGPYGKHTGTSRYDMYPNRAGVRDEWLSRHSIFEGPDPSYWCAHGYAMVVADSRGSWCSEGDLHIGGLIEAESAYDAIEWAAEQDWCDGNVGMSGVSYLAIIQWLAASLRPPHLAAINPWEGWTDTYREAFAHGGIPETGWSPQWNHRLVSQGRVEDIAAMIERYPLVNAYWEEKVPALERIEVPAYVVASWSDQGVFDQVTELTGYMEARLWVQPETGADMDLFVAVEKRDGAGELVGFPFSSSWEDGPVALGWLRASHRELDQDLSRPGQPWHRHLRELELAPAAATYVQIEIWPSATQFDAGERVRLVISGRDIHAPLHKHTHLRNKGAHILRTGGRYNSQLLVPIDEGRRL